MGWLLAKDLRILRRSPLLVALLVLYPVVVSVLVGLALSRGPDSPRVAFLNQVPKTAETIELGGREIDVAAYRRRIFSAIEPVRVSSRAEALQKVRDGEVLGALVIPPDATQKLQSGLEPAEVEVFYNAEDPVKARFVRDTIKSQVQDANIALSTRFTQVATGYLDLLVRGGSFALFGRDFQILGLERAERILRQARAGLPSGSQARRDVDEVIRFSRLARDNLDLSDDVLRSVGQPIRVKQTIVEGGRTPLSSFAVALAVTVSLMFVALLLAAGTLALEREENAFRRLLRGLVSGTALLAEKVVLAGACAAAVALLMLGGLALFVDVDAGRIPLAALAIAAGALAFGAMGTAIGALTREVRAASLLAFMLALPIAFLALVPSGSVAGGLYDLTRAVSALFPFRPTLDGLDAALNDAGGLAGPLLHLLALCALFGVAGRLALRRLA
jgi:ABC-2 type transport system permease protein